MLKILRAVDSGINKGIIIVMLPVFLIGIYLMYDNIYIFYRTTPGTVSYYKPETAEQAVEVLQELSNDCVAWITIDNTNLDYPIMQGENNLEYLNKDAYGNYSLSGAIFLDSRNTYDFSDKYSLVYGHHLEHGFLFGCLDDWFNEAYFNNHLTGTITTKDGVLYNYDIFAVCWTDAAETKIFNPVGSYPMEYIKNNATHYIEPQEGNLVILSTCKSAATTERIILCGIASIGETYETMVR